MPQIHMDIWAAIILLGVAVLVGIILGAVIEKSA